jgi:hypothetical protein
MTEDELKQQLELQQNGIIAINGTLQDAVHAAVTNQRQLIAKLSKAMRGAIDKDLQAQAAGIGMISDHISSTLSDDLTRQQYQASTIMSLMTPKGPSVTLPKDKPSTRFLPPLQPIGTRPGGWDQSGAVDDDPPAATSTQGSTLETASQSLAASISQAATPSTAAGTYVVPAGYNAVLYPGSNQWVLYPITQVYPSGFAFAEGPGSQINLAGTIAPIVPISTATSGGSAPGAASGSPVATLGNIAIGTQEPEVTGNPCPAYVPPETPPNWTITGVVNGETVTINLSSGIIPPITGGYTLDTTVDGVQEQDMGIWCAMIVPATGQVWIYYIGSSQTLPPTIDVEAATVTDTIQGCGLCVFVGPTVGLANVLASTQSAAYVQQWLLANPNCSSGTNSGSAGGPVGVVTGSGTQTPTTPTQTSGTTQGQTCPAPVIQVMPCEPSAGAGAGGPVVDWTTQPTAWLSGLYDKAWYAWAEAYMGPAFAALGSQQNAQTAWQVVESDYPQPTNAIPLTDLNDAN